jgi:flagellar protein FliO/FliZ
LHPVVKKIIMAFVIVLSFSSLTNEKVAFGKEGNTVYDAYSNGKKNQDAVQGTPPTTVTQTSLVPSFLKFIFSFAAIILLLLLCLKFLKAKSRYIPSEGPFHSMGGYPLGSNRSLQMLMIGKTLYILGIGNEVRLLRTIEPGQEQDLILQSLVEETESKQKLSLPALFKKKSQTENWEQTFMNQMNQMKQSSIPINKLKD